MVTRIPGDILDELVVAVLFLGLADVNVRARCEGKPRATDATPSGHGAVEADCPEKVVRAFFRVSKHRG